MSENKGGAWFGRFQDIVQFVSNPFINKARKWSIWGLTSGIMCCALEMMAVGCSRYDAERFGMLFRPSPRHADLLIINGPVSHKYASRLKQLYDQMAYPKWVIATGECAISGGPYWDSYSIIGGGDEVIPVDVYVPGCPVRPEAIITGVRSLQEKIQQGKKWTAPEKLTAPMKLVHPSPNPYLRQE